MRWGLVPQNKVYKKNMVFLVFWSQIMESGLIEKITAYMMQWKKATESFFWTMTSVWQYCLTFVRHPKFEQNPLTTRITPEDTPECASVVRRYSACTQGMPQPITGTGDLWEALVSDIRCQTSSSIQIREIMWTFFHYFFLTKDSDCNFLRFSKNLRRRYVPWG